VTSETGLLNRLSFGNNRRPLGDSPETCLTLYVPRMGKSNKPLHIRLLRRVSHKAVATLVPWLIAAYMLLLKMTCRKHFHNDPRALLREANRPYVFSVLHAHQLAAATCGDRGVAAMVSQSRDGGAVALGLRAVGIKPIRGSSRRHGQDKGGLAALIALINHVRSGQSAFLAVDGPRGPRNRAHKGIAVLSQKSGGVVINAAVIPSRRWIFARSWDRFQVPLPFCRVDCYFAAPIHPQAGESVEAYRRRIEAALNQLEVLHDQAEAVLNSARGVADEWSDSGASAAA
jgi:lysophospholipid acyltransferase (LPLAT)-like uncharacterized protein